MRLYTFLSTLFLPLLLSAFCLSAVPVHAELSWDIQVVDENASWIGNGQVPIAVDSDGNPHIAYSGRPPLSYASWNGSGWSIQNVTYNNKTAYGFALDFKLDAHDTPHILSGSVAYSRWTGTEWDTQTVTTDHTVFASLALDSHGSPHVAYITGDELKYATLNGSNWTNQTVDTLPEINFVVSLALDSNDTPHIMYSSPSFYVDNSTGVQYRSINVKLAVWKDSSWSIESVLASLTVRDFGNMILDSNDHLHFLCSERRYFSAETAYLRDILYVSWDGSSWNTQTVALNVTLEHIGFLALGPDDYPHIVYISGDVIYTRWTGTTWENQTVGDATNKPCCLAVDSNGNPHISYLKYPPNASNIYILNLMYATATIPDTQPSQPLNVSIVSPENKTYSTTEVPLTFTASEQASSIYYSVNGEANVSITGNTTLTNLTNGTHNLTIYAEDNIGNTGVSETIYFTISEEADSSPAFPDSTLLLVSAAIIIGAVITVVYVWRKVK